MSDPDPRNDFPPVLTTAMAAELLQVHVEYLRRMVREGRIPCHRFPGGRGMRFLRDELLEWLAALPGADQSASTGRGTGVRATVEPGNTVLVSTLHAPRHEYGDYAELLDDYYERGWTDGLPVVPPTPELVAEFLAVAELDPDVVIGAVPTREVTVTAEHVAINAVMAGCKREYMPVVIAAVRAHLNEKGNCHSTTGTLSGAAQVVIVNGPARTRLDVNCTAGCFGPGWRANATIGRALRLVIRNVCRSIPNFLDRGSFSTPARYSFCFGEDEEGSPWIPMSVERGVPEGTSAVTVASMMTMASALDLASRTPEGILDTITRTIRQRGTASDVWLGDNTNVVVVMGPEHRRFLVEAGWSKADARAYLWPRVKAEQGPGEGRVGLGKPEGILLVAAGGPGMSETWILFPHLAWAITEPVVPEVAAPSAERG